MSEPDGCERRSHETSAADIATAVAGIVAIEVMCLADLPGDWLAAEIGLSEHRLSASAEWSVDRLTHGERRRFWRALAARGVYRFNIFGLVCGLVIVPSAVRAPLESGPGPE